MDAQDFETVPDVLYQAIGEEAVLLNLNNDHYYGLDDVGTRMWQLLQEHGEPEAVVQQMVIEYEAREEVVRCDLAALITQLEGAGLIRRK
jgi:uncharacterized protein YcgL (UPF0745 family)